MRPVWSVDVSSPVVLAQDLELGIGNLQAARAPMLGLAVDHDARVRPDDIFQERLIRPDGLDLAARVLDQRGEQPEAGAARGLQARVQHLAADRDRLPRPDRHDWLQPAAILVADRKAKQQILDGRESRALEIGRLARSDAFQKLQRRLEELGRHESDPTWRGRAGGSLASERRARTGVATGRPARARVSRRSA